MALGVIGSNAVAGGVLEFAAEVDAQQDGGVVLTVLKSELPSIALPTFGCPEAETGLPKTAIPEPLNSTRLPAPPPCRRSGLNDTPGPLLGRTER